MISNPLEKNLLQESIKHWSTMENDKGIEIVSEFYKNRYLVIKKE